MNKIVVYATNRLAEFRFRIFIKTVSHCGQDPILLFRCFFPDYSLPLDQDKRMIVPTRKIFALFLTLSHLMVFGLHPILHHDFTVFSCSVEQQLFPHEDAYHSKHVSLAEHSDCPICASHQSRIAPEQNTLDNGRLQILDKIEIVPTVPLLQIHLFGSLSQRGPPSLLAEYPLNNI